MHDTHIDSESSTLRTSPSPVTENQFLAGWRSVTFCQLIFPVCFFNFASSEWERVRVGLFEVEILLIRHIAFCGRIHLIYIRPRVAPNAMRPWSSTQSLLILVFVIHFTTRATTSSSALNSFVDAAPISHSIPKEAALEMEGILQILPVSLQKAMSSSTGFWPAFMQSLMLILACELGDRTFFVAAILAMKSSRIVVWSGALTALAAMTVLSAAIGKAFPLLLDRKWTSMAAAALFAYFGVQLLRDWWRMRGEVSGENEELAEVEEQLRSGAPVSSVSIANGGGSGSAGSGNVSISDDDDDKKSLNAGRSRAYRLFPVVLISPVFAKALSMTALAEWGDRSQIATIALAAARDLNGVIVGGVVGHGICTGLAVVGGRLLASSISEKAVALMGGILFIVFAILTATGVTD